jgi:predicted DsbA family dithiol-disulfide isomerase
MRDKYDFEIETIGFEIHPDTPAEGKALEQIFPGYENMIGKLQAHGKNLGVEIGDISMLYNTNKALRVGELAKDKGVGNEFSVLMYKAYFTECLDISSNQVLVEKGALLNLTEEEVLGAIENKEYINRLNKNNLLGQKYGVRSVPTFIINDAFKVVGSESQDEIAKVFDQILAENK